MPATQTPQRLQLGRELRRWRKQAGIEAIAVAQRLVCAPSKISNIENGQATVSPLELQMLLALYGVPEGEPTERIMALAAAARQRSRYRVAPWARAYMGFEAEAAEIKDFQIELIPSLLQVEDYVRAIATAVDQTRPPSEVERLIRIRRERQAQLTGKDPLALTAVVHEAAIRCQVGGRDVLREQLAHLLRMGELPNVTLRLLPFTVGAHAASNSSFTILRMRDPGDSQVVYLEDLWGADYVNRQDQVEAYTSAFDRLVEVSLDEKRTTATIKEAMGELR